MRPDNPERVTPAACYYVTCAADRGAHTPRFGRRHCWTAIRRLGCDCLCPRLQERRRVVCRHLVSAGHTGHGRLGLHNWPPHSSLVGGSLTKLVSTPHVCCDQTG